MSFLFPDIILKNIIINTICTSHYSTRSSAIAQNPHNALFQLKSCQLLQSRRKKLPHLGNVVCIIYDMFTHE